MYSRKRGGIGKNLGDWIIPGLASLAWVFSAFFSLVILGLFKILLPVVQDKSMGLEVWRSVYSGFSISQYDDLR